MGGLLDWFWRAIRNALRRLAGCSTPTVGLSPARGPSGTAATLRIDGLHAGEPVTVTVGPGARGTAADANGRLVVTEILVGEPGQVLDVVVETGSGICEQTTRLRFAVTS